MHTDRIPRVSIGLPVYNGAAFLENALESLLAQDYTDFELVVSDNASTDATEEIVRRYAAQDARIRYVRETENRGAAWNFNRVARLARGRYFRWACHDDACHPSHLGRCVAALEASSPDTVLVYTRSRFIDAAGQDVGTRDDGLAAVAPRPHARLRTVLANVHFTNAMYGLLRTDALHATRLLGHYDSSDFVLLAELCLRGKFRELPEPLFLRRFHAGGSRAANLTPAELASWYDPGARRRLHLPETRVLLEHLNAVRLAPISRVEKLRAASVVVGTWLPRRAVLLAREYEALIAPRRAQRRYELRRQLRLAVAPR